MKAWHANGQLKALHANLAQFVHTAAGSAVAPIIVLAVSAVVILWAIGH
jgi:hypothetical protein